MCVHAPFLCLAREFRSGLQTPQQRGCWPGIGRQPQALLFALNRGAGLGAKNTIDLAHIMPQMLQFRLQRFQLQRFQLQQFQLQQFQLQQFPSQRL